MSKYTISSIRKTAASKKSSQSSSPILWKLLVPLALVAFILVFSFVSITWWVQNEDLDQKHDATVDYVKNEYARSLTSQSARLMSEMGWILEKHAIIEGLKQRDYNLLLNNSSVAYQRVSGVHGVTHFYYQDSDRVNILRVHKPDINGDTINRFTTLEAERTGDFVSGIELGPLGTFTLRAVMPVYSNGSLIGYMELGKEIEDILGSVSENTGAELTVFIDKEFLERGKWETGMAFLGRNADWDLYQSTVVIYSTPYVPDSFKLFSEVESRLKDGNSIEIENNGSIWHISSVPLNDASGEEVGFMLIMDDVTEEKAQFAKTLKMIIVGSLLVFSLLFLFYFGILAKTDRLIVENELILQESSDRFKSVIDAAYDSVIVVDSMGIIVHWNKSAESVFGYTKDEALGEDMLLIIPERYRAAHKAKFHGSTVRGRIVEIEGLRKDGNEVPIELSMSSWNSKNGRYYGAVIRDITKRKDAEAQLKNYAVELEHSNELKTIFTDIMRHDLMNPINFINGYLSVLQEQEDDLDKSCKLQDLQDATSRLILMIREASKFSRLEETEGLTLVDVDLNIMLFSSIAYVKNEADAKGISIDFNLAFPHFAKADPMVVDVFANILSNAIKYSPGDTKVTIDISDSGEFWKTSISDSGEGISDEDKPLVFDRFKRVTKGNIKGTGLGLAIVKRIVELHGGDVGVSDNPSGVGSIFWFTLKKGSSK